MPRALIRDPPQSTGAHKCSTCEKAFKNRSELARHENIHRKDKPFKCDVESCGKTFSQKGQLTNHQNTHSGARPITCAFCLRSFAEGGSTGRHEREQHSNFAGFRCPVSTCEYIHKRRNTYQGHLGGIHGIDPGSVDPWHHAYTTEGVKIDPTRGLIEQLEWEPTLIDRRGAARFVNRVREKRGEPLLAWRARQRAPALKTRSSRKRRADESEDEDEDEDEKDEEYKPNTRSRATKRMKRNAPEPEAEVKPTAPVVDSALTGLFTIAPASDHGSDAGVPSGSSSSLTSLVATPDLPQTDLRFAFDEFDCAASEAGPSTPCGPQNVLGLSVPDHSPVYGGYSSPYLSSSPANQYAAPCDPGLFTGHEIPQGFNQLDPVAFEASFCDGTFSFDNDFLNAPPPQFQASYDNYYIAQPNASPSLYSGHHYQHHGLAPTLRTDLLSVSSPLTASSQGTSRSPSPLGLVTADNGFSVPSISSLGRARAHAQMMIPQVRQDLALLDGYPTSM